MEKLSNASAMAVPRVPSVSEQEGTPQVESTRLSTTVREPAGALADIPGPRQPGRQESAMSIDRMRQRQSTLAIAPQSPGDTRALPTGSPLAGSREITPAHAAGAASASAQAASSSAIVSPHHALLARLADEFKVADERAVNPGQAAALINEVRRHGPRAHAEPGVAPAATNDELMGHISEEHVQAWFEAQGVNAEQASAMRHAAFLSGLPNPSGTFLTNALQFIASPWLSSATHKPWNGTALGLATAFASAPLNALQQSAVVTVGESIRDHGGPVVVPDKKNINDRHFLPELARQLEQRVQDFSSHHEAAAQLAQAHGLDLPALHEEMAAQREQGGDGRLPTALADLPAEALAALRRQGQRLLAAEEQLHVTQRDFLMTQGAHERQLKGNSWQAIPRTIRSPAAGLFSLLGKSGSGITGPIAQTVASLVITAGQHLAAGLDERNKQDYNNQLNLMYGDCLTETGHAKFARGEPVTAADIDSDKLRGFMQFPAQSFARQVARDLETQRAALSEDIDRRSTSSASGEAGAAQTAEAADLARDREALAHLESDIAHLKSGNLTQLHTGGLGESLLAATDGGVLSEALRRQVVGKYTMREFSAQTAQRVGQMFHLGVLGSAVPSVTGKVVSAVMGGVKKSPAGVVVGIAGASGIMAGIGARSTHTAISVKNNRREADPDIGLAAQVGRGVMGGLDEMNAQRAGKQASRAMNEALAEERINDTLQFARGLRALLGEVELVETLSLAEAAERLHPGHRSAGGADAVAIEMTPAGTGAGTSRLAEG